MTKPVNWLYCDDPSTSYFPSSHLSIALMKCLSQDNPRVAGFYILTIDTGSSETIPKFAKLENHCAARNGNWQSRNGSLWIYETEPVPFSKNNIKRAAKFYSTFVETPTSRDKVVMPVGDEAAELMRAIDERVGYGIREIKNLDELTRFKSKTRKMMIELYPTMDELLAAPA